MFLDESDYGAISLFNDKMNEINESSFSRWASEWRSRGNNTSEESRDTKFRGPDVDALKSFVLTLRFFIAPKDKCDIEFITKVYSKLPFDQIERQRFLVLKQRYDDFMGSDSGFGENGVSITNWELIELLIYGNLAHANPDKKIIVDKWLHHDDIAHVYLSMFAINLAWIYDLFLLVQELNNDLLKDRSV